MKISQHFHRKTKQQQRKAAGVSFKPTYRPGCYWMCGHILTGSDACPCETIEETSVKISQQFVGSYFKAADLPQPRVLTIQAVELATLPEGESKPAVQFVGEQQQLCLNKTNGFVLAEMFGDDTDAWKGRAIELYATTTAFSGRMVPCIRVRAPQQLPPQQPAPQPAPAPVPGAAPQQHVAPQQPPQPPMQAPDADYPVDA